MGVFGAAAVVAKMLHMSVDETTNAFAIAGSEASGVMEYDQSGGEVKRVHAGIAARAGVNSALLAGFGLTGPVTIIEGKRGFCHLFSTRQDFSRITMGLGRTFNITNAWLKLYPATAPVHTSIRAAERLILEHGIEASEIARIRIAVAETSLLHGGGIRQPVDVIGAQFSFAYSVALRLTKHRNDLQAYRDPTLWADPQIVDLMDRIELVCDPAAQGPLLHMATLTIWTKDGRLFETVERYPIGTPENPPTKTQLRDKIVSLSTSVLSADRIEGLIEVVENLEAVSDIRKLTSLLVPNGSAEHVRER